MRRLFSQRSQNTGKEGVTSLSARSNKSKHTLRRRGHSLMYRTELSHEKVRKNSFQECKVSKNDEEGQKMNDYLLRNSKTEKNNRKTTMKKGQFLKMRVNKDRAGKIDNFHRQYTPLEAKTCTLILRPSSQSSKDLYSKKFHSMKSINTTDTKKETYDSLRSSYACNYQIQNILEGLENQTQGLSPVINAVTPSASSKKNEDYQIYKPNRLKKQTPSKLSSVIQKSVLSPKQTSNMQSYYFTDPRSSKLTDLVDPYKFSRLPLESRKCSILQSQTDTVGGRISLHLQILGQLAQYSKSMIEMYENLDDWEESIFLVYKKYYLERVKVLDSLKNHIPYNPFCISVCSVSKQQLTSFRKKLQCQKLINQVETQNKTVVIESLRSFYNLIIQKSGQFINLSEIDNFSSVIFREMNTQIILLKDMLNEGEDRIEVERRLRQIYRTAFLISELNGNFKISYEQSLDDDCLGSYFGKAEHFFKSLLNF